MIFVRRHSFSSSMNDKTLVQKTSRFGLGQVNTADFLFDDETQEKDNAAKKKTQTTSPDVKSYLQMMDTNDKFPILTQTGKVREITIAGMRYKHLYRRLHGQRPGKGRSSGLQPRSIVSCACMNFLTGTCLAAKYLQVELPVPTSSLPVCPAFTAPSPPPPLPPPSLPSSSCSSTSIPFTSLWPLTFHQSSPYI